MIYLDWAATSLPDIAVWKKAFSSSLENFGNPSSVHGEGRKAKKVVEDSRTQWAEALGCRENNIVFTSGGSEANNLVLQHAVLKKRPPSVVISSIEHPSLFEGASRLKKTGCDVRLVHPEKDGRVLPEKFAEAVDRDDILRVTDDGEQHNRSGTAAP